MNGACGEIKRVILIKRYGGTSWDACVFGGLSDYDTLVTRYHNPHPGWHSVTYNMTKSIFCRDDSLMTVSYTHLTLPTILLV